MKLSVIRRGKTEPQEMEITLAKLPAPKMVEDRLEGDIAYLRVPEFEPGDDQADPRRASAAPSIRARTS